MEKLPRFLLAVPLLATCGMAQDAATNAVPDVVSTNAVAEAPVLPPLTVTASHLHRTLRDVAAFASVIDRSGAQNDGFPALTSTLTTDQAISHLAGVDYQSHGLPGATVKLDFRGITQDFGAKSALAIMDGRRLNDPFQGNVEYSMLNSRNIESITVLRGPASYLYGSGAMSGLVDVKMRNGMDKEPFGEFSVEGGNHNTWNANVAAGGQFGDVDLYGGASYFHTHGYHPYKDTPRVDWESQDYFGNVGYRPTEWDTFRFMAGFYKGEGFDREGDRDVKRHYQQASWVRDWATARAQKTTLRLNNTQEHSKYHIAPAGGAMMLDLTAFGSPMYPYRHLALDYTRDYQLRSTGADLTHQMELTDRIDLAVGGEVRLDTARLRDYSSTQYPREYVFGLFAETDIKLLDNLTLSLGLRFDKNESFDAEYSPRAALLWHVTPDAEAYVSISKAFQTPGLSDRYIDTMSIYYPGSPIAVALPYHGNPLLKPTKLIAYEAGFRQRFNDPLPGVKKAEFNLALFYNAIKDDFDFRRFMTSYGTLEMQVENAARAHTTGIEAEFRFSLDYGFELFAYGSYMYGRYDKSDIIPDAYNEDIEDNRMANLAPWKFGGGLQWHNTRMSHGLFVRFEDERYAGADNTDKLDAYVVFDWASRVKLTDNLAVSLVINNLFDQDYRVYDIISPTGYPAVGRTYRLGLEGKF